jgi:ABC-2 type transport system ATP-binding protein
VHVLHEGRPEEGFEAVEPNLEDVYFSILRAPAEARHAA